MNITYTLSLLLRIATRILLVLARFRENFLMSAHLGAFLLLAAMSFSFLPNGLLLFLLIMRSSDTYFMNIKNCCLQAVVVHERNARRNHSANGNIRAFHFL